MTLEAFLLDHSLDAVDTLPDNRLINVVVDGGGLYGVVEPDLPDDATLMRRAPAVLTGTLIQVDGLVFDTTQYTML